MVKTPCRNAGDMGSIPGWGRSHMPCGVTKKKKKKMFCFEKTKTKQKTKRRELKKNSFLFKRQG